MNTALRAEKNRQRKHGEKPGLVYLVIGCPCRLRADFVWSPSRTAATPIADWSRLTVLVQARNARLSKLMKMVVRTARFRCSYKSCAETV